MRYETNFSEANFLLALLADDEEAIDQLLAAFLPGEMRKLRDAMWRGADLLNDAVHARRNGQSTSSQNEESEF